VRGEIAVRRKARLFVFLSCLLASFLTGGCGPGKEQAANRLEKIDFLIDWQAEPTYLGVYYAGDLGLFQKLGLDVSIVQSWGANQAVSAVAAGRYKIATASGGAAVLAYNNDARIVSLGVLYPRVPTVIFGLAKSGIHQPKDLIGKTIGIYPGSINNNEFEAFVKLQKLDPKKLKIVSVSGPDIPLLLAGKVDAVLNYTELSPVILSTNPRVTAVHGSKVFELPLADYGVAGYGLNVVTSRQTLQQEPGKVRKIADAVFEGYRVGCVQQEQAVDSFLKHFPDRDPASVKEAWRRVCAMVGPNPGQQSEEGWKETIEFYRSLGLLTHNVEPKDILP
jgi:ABC-type nitrate/sulfonate/bicarbonate transport system substrate-binding protein